MVYDSRGNTPVHMDKALTNISVGWPNGDFVGSRMLPQVNVMKQSTPRIKTLMFMSV